MSPGPWRLVWSPEAIEVNVAQATVTAMERGHDVSAIADAMERAERELAVNPAELGESRPHGERVHYVRPLNIRFAVHEDERIVYVLGVVYAPPRFRG
ncbi:MAG: hypothetical protein K2X82_16630 [Gemmataceae bacterium]|nr:hypothetical protein [Gemmataceae bacterium]